jgi:mannobiose 2-epimerase
MAQRAFVYMIDTFMDSEYGGVYWLVDPQGQVLDDKKRIYGQAFAIYSLSEYYAATQYPFALEQIQTLFDRIDTTCRDADHRGYLETFNRDWSVSETMQLSMVDMDEKKSMNTHLHLMEAYTRLFEIDPSPRVRERLGTLIDIFLETIIDSNTHHFQLFFDEFWNPKTDRISYGHDIEGAWLLWEAVSVLGDEQRKHRLTRVLPPLVNAVRSQAMNDQGGLYYETLSDGGLCRDVHWWTQAEAVVGFLDAFQHFGHIEFLESAQNAWSYIESHLIDWQYGEWIYKIPAGTEYKVSEWKGPYHNTRACLELLNRLS